MTSTTAVAATTIGRVSGRTEPWGATFLGIPYARPPFGPDRFGAPRPAEPWTGTRDATIQAPTAPQPAQGFTIIPEPVVDGGEQPDCLALNIFTPDLGAAALPVLVWFHGGGFLTGTPSSPWYDGRSFARDGVVVVSVGYRLGAEAFLHLDDAPPNRGVLDWLAALRWVQDNVAAFGGDPSRVTIGGQSAGGAACSTLATLPAARDLFGRVIAMSGSVGPSPTLDRARAVTAAVAGALGCEPTAAALRSVTPADLVAAQLTTPPHSGSATSAIGDLLPYAPYLDGEVVSVHPLEAIRSGATAHLDLLVGTTAEEMDAAMRSLDLDDDRLRRRLGRLGLDPAGVDRYATDPGSNGERYGRALTDASFRVPALRVAEARACDAAATYHYEFRWRAPASGFGSVHCLDLPFAWDLLDAERVDVVAGDAPPQGLADRMHRAWVDFISAGDPGWPRFELDTRTSRVFDEEDQVVSDLDGERLGRW